MMSEAYIYNANKQAPKADLARPQRLKAEMVNVYYDDKHALINVSMEIPDKSVTAFIGPSGCGKSTFLRSLNRMNDVIDSCRVTGEIFLDGQNVYAEDYDAVLLRANVGMVFQKPTPFPKSIYENIAYGIRLHGLAQSKAELDDMVESALHRAGLWEEVRTRLDQPATGMSGGQQQRLCIARSIAIEPEVLLLDEPCSALDPIATSKIEELITELKSNYTIVIVTHNMQQARRIADQTAYFHLGEMVEMGKTNQIFDNPKDPRTESYISGRFG